MMKVLKWIGIVLIVLVVGVFGFVQLTWKKTFEAPYPEIVASTDSAMIARGKYLAYGPSHCATCHIPMNKIMAVENGEIMPMIGGWDLEIPPGRFRAPNLTPDKETGIGKYTDKEIARILRHGVGHDGRAIFPFMPFQEMSNEDLTAIISFLRSQEPIKNDIPRSEYTFLGKFLFAIGAFKPEATKNTPVDRINIDTTVEYGKYIAHNVANCVGCHTNRNLQTGEFTGEQFAGGLVMPPDAFSEGKTFRTPNITPDEKTGIMASWSEQAFVNRFKGGRAHKGSPMPWGSFSRMNEVEIKAVYRYLKSLKPVENKIDKVVFEPGDKVPDA